MSSRCIIIVPHLHSVQLPFIMTTDFPHQKHLAIGWTDTRTHGHTDVVFST